MDIFLVGTNHSDLNGKRRLELLLDHLLPDVLCVEGNEATPAIRKIYAERLAEACSSQPALARYLRHRTESYEVSVCRDYAKNKSIPLFYLDPPYTEHNLTQINDIIKKCASKEVSLPVPTEEQHQIMVEFFYSLIDMCFVIGETPPHIRDWLLSPLPNETTGERDDYFEKIIRPLAMPEKRVVCVMGAAHLIDDPEGRTLYERIKDLSPKRTIVANADNITSVTTQHTF